MNPKTLKSLYTLLRNTSFLPQANHRCMALILGLVTACACSTRSEAVEISFFAPVELEVDQCQGFSYCSTSFPASIPPGSFVTGSISGTVEVADPLSDSTVELSDLTNFGAGAPFPFIADLSSNHPSFSAIYTAPTSLGEVGQLTISAYKFSNLLSFFGDVRSFSWSYSDSTIGVSIALIPQNTSPLSATTNFVYAVPEPTTGFLLLSGFLAMTCRRRR